MTTDGSVQLENYFPVIASSIVKLARWGGCQLELITFEILAAERLRLMGFDNRLIIDCFTNVVNILFW